MWRADRQLVGAVSPDREAALGGIKLQPQHAAFEFDAVLIAEQGHQDFIVQVAPFGVPVDVEPPGMGGIRSPFQHVEPQRIVRTAHPHVIRHEVENLQQRVFLQRLAHLAEGGVFTELGIELAMIDDVVAVGAAGPRLEVR